MIFQFKPVVKYKKILFLLQAMISYIIYLLFFVYT